MNLHLLAVNVKASDYEWSEPKGKPEMHSVQPPAAPEQTPTVEPIFWGTPEFDAAIEKMYSTTRTPEWQAANERKQQEKAERRRQREARIAERRQRRSKAA